MLLMLAFETMPMIIIIASYNACATFSFSYSMPPSKRPTAPPPPQPFDSLSKSPPQFACKIGIADSVHPKQLSHFVSCSISKHCQGRGFDQMVEEGMDGDIYDLMVCYYLWSMI